MWGLGSSAMLALALSMTLAAGDGAQAEPASAARPWLNPALSPARRADLALAAMTPDEKFTLVSGEFGTPFPIKAYQPPSAVRLYSAGYVPGIERLGIPPQWQTDAGMGVATQRGPEPRERTSLPSGLAIAASWNPTLAQAGGAMIGAEARLSGFNVMLAGGTNLARETRNGRNFEYAGEDPLLAGRIVGAEIKGIQSNHIISTIKHFALNDQETGRNSVSAEMADDQARASDLLAFEIAIGIGDPGAVMCSYNRVGGVYACENPHLLNEVLKGDWGFGGYVLSDWGGVHSTVEAANNGLDQQSAAVFDDKPYFREPLRRAVLDNKVSAARLDDMVRRILLSMFSKGLVDHPVADTPQKIDFAAHAATTREAAEESIVLLKNEGDLLPLAGSVRSIAVIGGHADVGVLSGGGSSQVYPRGGAALMTGPDVFPGPELYFPSSPMKEIQARAPQAKVSYADGGDVAAAARLAAGSDMAIVFATQWAAEALDTPFTLRAGQDALIAAVARANPKTIVVLETGNPVAMPWLDKVPAVLEAWYPGTEGGQAIARILFGQTNPSGRLPITFPRSEDQLPHRTIATGATASYAEGAAVGYKWFDKQASAPLFAFGHGLSYSRFEYGGLVASPGPAPTVRFEVRNTGRRAGKTVAQVYVSPKAGGWEAPKRLVAFEKVDLAPGGAKVLTLAIDPRLLATYDSAAHAWKMAGGEYNVILATSARETVATTPLTLDARTLGALNLDQGQPAPTR